MKKCYTRMLALMEEKEKHKSILAESDQWYLYILRCSNGTLYTGITKDIDKRLNVHNTGKGAKYTRTWRPVELVYSEQHESRTQALVRECEVKSLPKKKKECLVKGK